MGLRPASSLLLEAGCNGMEIWLAQLAWAGTGACPAWAGSPHRLCHRPCPSQGCQRPSSVEEQVGWGCGMGAWSPSGVCLCGDLNQGSRYSCQTLGVTSLGLLHSRGFQNGEVGWLRETVHMQGRVVLLVLRECRCFEIVWSPGSNQKSRKDLDLAVPFHPQLPPELLLVSLSFQGILAHADEHASTHVSTFP